MNNNKNQNQYRNQNQALMDDKLISSLKEYSDINNNFYIVRVTSHEIRKLFIKYITYFYNKYDDSPYAYVGIDFEYNEHRIALCQLIFFDDRPEQFVFLFDPMELSSDDTNILIRQLYRPRSITKLLHGSVSLDLPYIFNELFQGDIDTIYEFIMSVIDTVFLCDYSKLTEKCSLYDALLFYNVINKQTYDTLQNAAHILGPVQDVKWNIHNMSSYHITYTTADVIYLHDFYTKLMHYNNRYILLITRFILCEKYGVSDLSNRIKKGVDPMNNYFINTDEGSIKLIEIYENVIGMIKFIKIQNISVSIKNLLEINYFKSILTLLFKFIIYSIIVQNYEVHINKKTIYDKKIVDQLELKEIFDTLKDLQLFELRKLVKWFYIRAEKNINLVLQ